MWKCCADDQKRSRDMADVTNELMYEVLKQIQLDIAGLKEGQREHSAALGAIRTYCGALQQDVSNIYSVLVRLEARMDRAERRLELRAPALVVQMNAHDLGGLARREVLGVGDRDACAVRRHQLVVLARRLDRASVEHDATRLHRRIIRLDA